MTGPSKVGDVITRAFFMTLNLDNMTLFF